MELTISDQYDIIPSSQQRLNKEFAMRFFTKELLDEMEKDKVYRVIMDTPPPDLTLARKDAKIFARWIAQEHHKERNRLKRETLAV